MAADYEFRVFVFESIEKHRMEKGDGEVQSFHVTGNGKDAISIVTKADRSSTTVLSAEEY